MGGSLSFDRAAGYYDATRITDDGALAAIVELLNDELTGRVLEIGVGTGQLALPVAASGLEVTGLDLSAEMMAQLRAKPGGAGLPLVRGDATRLPFRDGAFGGAYARWVLHLVQDWEGVLDELIRVTGSDAAIAIEPGGISGGVHRDIHLRFMELLGDDMVVPGLQPIGRDGRLDEAMAARGWACVRTEPITYEDERPLAAYFDGVPRRTASWTWNIPEGELTAATDQVRAWAANRWDLDAPLEPVPTSWRVFRADASP